MKKCISTSFVLLLLLAARTSFAQIPLQIAGLLPVDRVYNGTTNITFTGKLLLVGVEPDHQVTIVGDASLVKGYIEDASAGFDKIVQADLSLLALAGPDQDKYTLAPESLDLKVSVHTRPVRIDGLIARNKKYDGSDLAGINDDEMRPDPRDKIDGDDLRLAGSIRAGRFSSAGPGVAIPVVIDTTRDFNLSLEGSQSHNYVIARDGKGVPKSSKALTADIAPK